MWLVWRNDERRNGRLRGNGQRSSILRAKGVGTLRRWISFIVVQVQVLAPAYLRLALMDGGQIRPTEEFGGRRRSMDSKLEVITINGIEYVPKGTQSEPAKQCNGMKYVICRTYSAGVFAGYLESRNGQEVAMRQARRLWQWAGAASLSQMAMQGTSKPKECKFPCAVDRVELTQAIEILDCTEQAKVSIAGVPEWTA